MHNGPLSDSNALIFEEIHKDWLDAPETEDDRLEVLRMRFEPDGTFVEFAIPEWMKDLYKEIK